MRSAEPPRQRGLSRGVDAFGTAAENINPASKVQMSENAKVEELKKTKKQNGKQLLCDGRDPPDLPTPALPKTASFTSGLLAMTAARLGDSFGGGRRFSRPSRRPPGRRRRRLLEETVGHQLLHEGAFSHHFLFVFFFVFAPGCCF